MQYRIDLSTTRRGAARVHLPGRTLDLEAVRASGTDWDVSISDALGTKAGLVTVSTPTANDAVWHVARAAVRAYAALTGTPLEEAPLSHHSDESR